MGRGDDGAMLVARMSAANAGRAVPDFAIAHPATNESRAAKFGESGLDLGVAGEAAFLGIEQSAINAFKLSGIGLINAILETGVDIERDLRQLVLPLWRPTLHALKNFSEALCSHRSNIKVSTVVVMAGHRPSKTGVNVLMSRPSRLGGHSASLSGITGKSPVMTMWGCALARSG